MPTHFLHLIPTKRSKECMPHSISRAIVCGMLALLVMSGCAPYRFETMYREDTIVGWRVRVSSRLIAEEPGLLTQTLTLLQQQLTNIALVVPESALAKLRNIPIWIDFWTPHPGAMQYHASRTWLAQHGYNPDKENSVEISHPNLFLQWSRDQPWLVLHELAHGYHATVLGIGYQQVAEAYENARMRRLYDNVERYHSRSGRAYAITNVEEYFAELSEAYFGLNDFFPFTRKELRQFDPIGFEAIETAWQQK